jgi:hypothetical protein
VVEELRQLEHLVLLLVRAVQQVEQVLLTQYQVHPYLMQVVVVVEDMKQQVELVEQEVEEQVDQQIQQVLLGQ